MKRVPLYLAITMVVAAPSLSAQVTARRPFLFKDARSEIAAARARGDADVLLVIASMPGANERVARIIACTNLQDYRVRGAGAGKSYAGCGSAPSRCCTK